MKIMLNQSYLPSKATIFEKRAFNNDSQIDAAHEGEQDEQKMDCPNDGWIASYGSRGHICWNAMV
ncbi:MAG: hypothetical protein K0S80_3395 [Neobacillus sp.]|nr:hypothetical protein [Neobacillus sp.]